MYPKCHPNRMGITPGWADTYVAQLHGQELNIKNLPDGIYTLESVVNPGGRLVAEREQRGRARIRIRIDKTTDTVKVLRK